MENPTTSTTNEYTAITKNALIENTKLAFDLFLRNDVNGQARYILFCRADDHFSAKRQEELLSKNAEKLYISKKDTDKYLLYQEENLKSIVDDKNKTPLEKSGALYQVAANITEELLENPKSGKHIERASAWIGNTVNHILKNENTFSSLFEVTAHDYHTYTHSINMSVIGLLFGKYLSLSEHELDCLGTGMLLHDIGKVVVSPEIINKAGRLTKEEFCEIRKHTKAGLDILEPKKSVDSLCLKVVAQHHENHDGTGYPSRLEGREIHLFGSISRIIDVYDAMTTHRPYAAAKRPFAALAEMKAEMLNCFNEELLKEFICFLGAKDSRKKLRASDTLITSPSLAK
jgi:HD-GYP domain-containing protein (c-di-GMP phosphodiesterase class II)